MRTNKQIGSLVALLCFSLTVFAPAGAALAKNNKGDDSRKEEKSEIKVKEIKSSSQNRSDKSDRERENERENEWRRENSKDKTLLTVCVTTATSTPEWLSTYMRNTNTTTFPVCIDVPNSEIQKIFKQYSKKKVDTAVPTVNSVSIKRISSSGVVISWATNENSKGKLYYSTTQPVTNTSPSIAASNGNTTKNHSAVLSGLAANQSYYFYIESTDTAGNAGSSGTYAFTTSSGSTPADTVSPVISGINTSGITVNSSIINWNTNEVSDSRVYFGTTSPLNIATATFVSNGSHLTSHSMPLSGLVSNTTYRFIVSSKDPSGNFATSSEQSFTTNVIPDTVAPILSGISLSAISSSTATVSWFSNELSLGKIYYSTTSPISLIASIAIYGNLLSGTHVFPLSGLSTSTVYYFLVNSTDASGNSATSSEQSFITNP